MKLSLALAVRNEEENLHHALGSTIEWVDEVVLVDGESTDKTVDIARSYGPKVKIIRAKHETMFHKNKQKALDAAVGDWILQLDADEEVSADLAQEIQNIIKMSQTELSEYQNQLPERELFLRNQRIIESSRQSKSTDYFNAFYLPRLNFFLGRFLHFGGQYPDGSVRLIRKGKAHFPMKDVHEVMEVVGRSGWLQNSILHYDSPTFKRYIERNTRYVNMMAEEFNDQKLPKNFINFMNFVLYKPFVWFFTTVIFNKGILDGWQGVVFSFFSAMRFARAYIRYLKSS